MLADAGFKLREVRIWSEKALNVAPRPGAILSEAFWMAIFFCGLCWRRPPTLVPSQIGSGPNSHLAKLKTREVANITHLQNFDGRRGR